MTSKRQDTGEVSARAWAPPSRVEHDGPAATEVWRVSLDVTEEHPWAGGVLLDPDELARARRFHRRQDGRRWSVARSALRTTLARYTGIEPEAIVFDKVGNGKPVLREQPASGPLHFNLAHSRGLALLAVRREGPVGIDVERIRQRSDVDRLARRVLTERERGILRDLGPAERRRAFFDAWTRKEAVVKALGKGLSFSVLALDVSLRPDEPARLEWIEGDDASRWTLRALHVGSGYAACFAFRE